METGSRIKVAKPMLLPAMNDCLLNNLPATVRPVCPKARRGNVPEVATNASNWAWLDEIVRGRHLGLSLDEIERIRL